MTSNPATAPSAPYQRILVAVDGSPTAWRGLEEAMRLARLTHGRIRLMNVINEAPLIAAGDSFAAFSLEYMNMLRDNGQAILNEAGKAVQAQGIAVDTVLENGFDGALHDIVARQATQWSADLLVLGTHGRRGIGRMLLGSGAESILRVAPVPVLLVRADATVRATEEAPARAAAEVSHAAFQLAT